MLTHEQQGSHFHELHQIPNILEFFSLGHMANATLLTGGDANHNYVVKTQEGLAYVVKFPIEQTPDSLVNDVTIAKQLATAGIESSLYLHRADGKFIYDQGSMAVVSVLIAGIHPEIIDSGISSAIGTILAKFHAAVSYLPNQREAWLNPATIARPTNQEDNQLTQQARRFLAEGIRMYNYPLPSGIIHGDLHEDNLLVDEDDQTRIVALFDFEEAEENLYIVDIALSILSVCATQSGTKLDPDVIREFINGYSSVRPLKKEELENLPNAIKWSTGAAMLWYIKNGFLQKAQNAISKVESLNIL